MIRKISFIPILVFFAILYFLYGGLGKDPTLIPSPLIGKQVPSFFSETLILEEEISNEGLIGKPYILNVWGSWCYGCNLEHDHLLDIKLKNKIEIYGLNYKDNRNDAKEWLKTKGNPYKKIGSDMNGETAINWGVYGVPETFLIDKDGIIILRHAGPITKDVMINEILPKLKEINL